MKKNNNRYTRFLLGIGYILTILMLSGCQIRKSNHSITFTDDKVIEYTSDFKISDLIKAVDSYGRSDFKINEDDTLITLPNGKTVSINVTNKKIKLDTIKFDFRYMNETYTKEVIIQDTTAPSIDCKDVYEVALGNEYFSLEKLISSKDNYTIDSEVEIYFNGTYDVNKEGDYQVQIIAYDMKKNKTEKTVKIIVKEEEPIIIEKPSEYQGESSSKNSESISNNGNHNNFDEAQKSNSEVSSQQNNNYIPETRKFTIESYASFDECMSACQTYINECLNNGYTGKAVAEPIKENDVYIGYKAVFY